jgi:peptidoglycan/LPS O-acetylase OafA/YrhL
MASPTHIADSKAEAKVLALHVVQQSPREPLAEHMSGGAIPDWSRRIPALDGLRGIAILLVLMRHSIFIVKTTSKFLLPVLAVGKLTWSGVDLFFILSGFLIGGILLDAKSSPRYFRTFYLRRAFRIYPLYYVVAVVFLSRFVPFHLPSGALVGHPRLPIPWAAYLTLTQNFWLFGLPGAMEATWSLCIEEQFYLVIPLLMRIVSRRQLVITLVSMIIGAPFLRMFLHYRYPHGDYFCYVLAPCRADALCLGVLSAVLVRDASAWRWLVANRSWLQVGLISLFVGVIYMTWRGYGAFQAPMTTFGLSWIALFYTCILLLVVSDSQGGVRNALCKPWLTGLGTLAYCIYLVHVPLLHAGRHVFAMVFEASSTTNWFLGGLVGIVSSLIVAVVSWRFFEKPLLRMGHRYVY